MGVDVGEKTFEMLYVVHVCTFKNEQVREKRRNPQVTGIVLLVVN